MFKISLWREDAAVVAVLAAAGMAIGFIDSQEPKIISESTQVAADKKQALVGIPCATWICQKSFDHEPCGRAGNTACAPMADLTERTK